MDLLLIIINLYVAAVFIGVPQGLIFIYLRKNDRQRLEALRKQVLGIPTMGSIKSDRFLYCIRGEKDTFLRKLKILNLIAWIYAIMGIGFVVLL